MKIYLQLKSNFRFKLKKYLDTVISYMKSIRNEVLYVYGFFFIVTMLLVLIFKKEDLHLTINEFHCSFFDQFFKYITHLGDGVMFGVLTVVFFFIKRKMALVFIIGGVLTLVITHFFKKIIYNGTPRPAKFLEADNLYLIDGVKMAFWNSFPSGHTMTAFAVFVILCLYFRKCISQYLWISLAVTAGFSRVYLSQHFLIDIFAGSMFGILIAFISMSIFYPKRKMVH